MSDKELETVTGALNQARVEIETLERIAFTNQTEYIEKIRFSDARLSEMSDRVRTLRTEISDLEKLLTDTNTEKSRLKHANTVLRKKLRFVPEIPE